MVKKVVVKEETRDLRGIEWGIIGVKRRGREKINTLFTYGILKENKNLN